MRGGEGAEKSSESRFPLTIGSRMPVLPGLKSHKSKRWDLSLNLEKQVLENLVQLPPRSQWGQSCPDLRQLQF